DTPNANEVLQSAKQFWDMGGEIDADDLREVLGLAKPSPGSTILSQAQGMNPMGVGAIPQGMPQIGPAGPDESILPGGDEVMDAGSPPPEEQGDGSSPFVFKRQGEVVQLAAPGVAEPLDPESFLDPEEKQVLAAPAERQRFYDAYQNTPEVNEFVAAANAGVAKRGWYRQAAGTIKTLFGKDANRFAGLLAATSPRNPVDHNLRTALRVWQHWNEQGRPQDKDAIRQLFSPVAEPDLSGKLVERSVLMKPYLNNVVRVLSHPHESWENFNLSGPKVASFHQNLMGNLRRVTNDVWMARFAGIPHKKLTGILTTRDEAGSKATTSGFYAALTAKIRAATDALNSQLEPGQETWEPAEVQETVWAFVKSLVELQKHKRMDATTALYHL
ncbi:MAG: hypothetical protein L0241_32030, partial [Planctomycetia bacterium]|nr:hypothetical protein [Planctomycetia bacterium]